jgi:hypothetical protein
LLVQREAEERRPRDVVDAEGAAGQPLFVAHHQPHGGVEAQRREREVDGLHAQRREAEAEADHEAADDGQRQAEPEAEAGLHQDGDGVGADAEEGGVAERLLAGVADGEVEAHVGDHEHQPVAEEVEAVALHEGGHGDEQCQAEGAA